MANIEHVNVGGQVYDIRVPNGSSLSLSSLNVTGTITASTANLSVVKCAGKPLTVSLENTFGIFDFYQADRLRNKISLEFPLDTDHDFTLSLPNIDSNQATLLTTENAPFVVTDNEVYSKGVEVRLKDTNHVILLGAGLRTNGQEDGVKITIGDRVVIGPLYINAVTNNSTYIDAWIVRSSGGNSWTVTYFVQGAISASSTTSVTISCGIKTVVTNSDIMYLQSSDTSSTGVNDPGSFLVQQW